MWTPGILLAILAVASAQLVWKPNNEYRYLVQSRTATSIRDLDSQSAIAFVQAYLDIQPKSAQHLIARLEKPQYASIQDDAVDGEISEEAREKLIWNSLPLSQPFEMKLNNGVINELLVHRDVPVWGVNVLRSMVSQLQVDTQGENLMKSKMNSHPLLDAHDGAFKTMEDTVDGECETLYSITPLPQFLIQRQPELLPQPQLVVDGEILKIEKTKNFTNCERRPVYNHGFPAGSEWEPADNKMESWFSRSNTHVVVASGNLKAYTIQFSGTTSRISLNPDIAYDQKAEVYSQTNLTLESVRAISEEIVAPKNPQVLKSLVYDYNSPFEADQEVRAKWDARKEHSSESSASSSSSEEKQNRSHKDTRELDHDSSSLDSSSSSSESRSQSLSSEEWHQGEHQLSDAPNVPLLPFQVGYMGHSIQQQVNVNAIVSKLAQQIAKEVQNFADVPKTGTMERFTMLVDVIRTMSQKQIEKASSELYVRPEHYNNAAPTQKYASWMAFRDSVAEAGTGPALLTITNWIRNRQIEGEEAAQIVSSLTDAAKTPTPAYMKAFFEQLVKEDKIQSSDRLYSAVITAFTELLRMAQVDRELAHNRYPVHTYGPFSQKNEKNVVEIYVPYFSKQLQMAVRKQDSPKIQLFVRALGNIAHPSIIPVFEPYLEGQYPMTTFQRTHLVISMDKMARLFPKLARSVLFKIYSNEADDYQVRVAAVFNLMNSDLPVYMLQGMAESSKYESSQQVRSAIQTGIQSLAELTGEFNSEIRKNAQAAASLLAQEPMGIQYSQQNFTDYVNDNLNLAYEQSYRTIGSQDNLYPSSAFYKIRRQLNGFAVPSIKAGYMTSSVDDLIDLLEHQLFQQLPQHQKYHAAADKIKKLIIDALKVEADTQAKVEGTIRMNLAGSKRYYSFDNETIEELFKEGKELLLQLQSGYNFAYQKMFYDYESTVAFPTVTGIPFVYTSKAPSMYIVYGKIKAVLEQGRPSLSFEIQAGATTRHQDRAEFVTPYDHKRYIAAVDKNMHVMFPFKGEVIVDLKEQSVQVQFKPSDIPKQRLFHYSTWPYTTQQDVLSMKTLAEEQNTKYIEEREPVEFESTFGDKTIGVTFRVKAKTQKEHVDFKALYEQYENHDFVSAWAFPTAFAGLEQTVFDIFYEPALSPAKLVTFTAVYQQAEQEKIGEAHDSSNQAFPVDDKPVSQSRRAELLRKVQAGIKSSKGHVVDVALQITGLSKLTEFVATVAVANSKVDEKSRFLAYYRQAHLKQEKFEIVADGSAFLPFISIRDAEEALKDSSKGEVRLIVNYGADAKHGAEFTIKGKLQQSLEYQQYAKEQLDKSAQGVEQTQDIKYAGIFDQQEYTIKYQNIGKYALNMTYQAYSILRHLGYPYMSENIVDGLFQEQSNIAQVQLQFARDLTKFDIEINTPMGSSEFNHIRSPKLVTDLLAVNPMFTPAQRVGNTVLHEKYDATCYLGEKYISTFDGFFYEAVLPKAWHVLMVTEPEYQYENNEIKKELYAPIAVLGRQNQEVQIITYDDTTVEIIPGKKHPVVKVNDENIQVSDEKVWRNKNQGIEIFATRDGTVKAIFENLVIIHTNDRVLIRAGHRFMDQVQGLCGGYTGEEEDLFTPQQAFVDDFEQLVASWSLNPEGKQARLQQEVLKNAYQKKHAYSNAVSDQDAGRVDAEGKPKKVQRYDSHGSSSSSSSESDEQFKNQLIKDSQTGCAAHRIHVVEKDGKHCFSILPQASCKPHCKVGATKPRTTKFYCVEKTSTSEHWATMVSRGANPDFSTKGNAVEMKYDAPIQCYH